MLLLTIYAGKYTHTHLGKGDGGVGVWYVRGICVSVFSFLYKKIKCSSLLICQVIGVRFS